MLEELSSKLGKMDCIRVLSQAGDSTPIPISRLEAGDITPDQIFQTVSPAIAFQYMSEPDTAESRSGSFFVKTYCVEEGLGWGCGSFHCFVVYCKLCSLILAQFAFCFIL